MFVKCGEGNEGGGEKRLEKMDEINHHQNMSSFDGQPTLSSFDAQPSGSWQTPIASSFDARSNSWQNPEDLARFVEQFWATQLHDIRNRGKDFIRKLVKSNTTFVAGLSILIPILMLSIPFVGLFNQRSCQCSGGKSATRTWMTCTYILQLLASFFFIGFILSIGQMLVKVWQLFTVVLTDRLPTALLTAHGQEGKVNEVMEAARQAFDIKLTLFEHNMHNITTISLGLLFAWCATHFLDKLIFFALFCDIGAMMVSVIISGLMVFGVLILAVSFLKTETRDKVARNILHLQNSWTSMVRQLPTGTVEFLRNKIGRGDNADNYQSYEAMDVPLIDNE